MFTSLPQINLRNIMMLLSAEEWQRRHILENLPNLIRLTRCNVLFLSIIRNAGALSEYDEQELIHKYPVPVEKSKHFYEILVTRKNCYHILRDALEQTTQTGALETLDNALLTDVLNELDVPLDRIGEFKNNIDSKLDLDGSTLMHEAVETGGGQQLQKLKLLKADFEAKDNYGFTPLLRLAHAKINFADTLAWFVRKQIDLQALNNYGNNLVFLAALNGRSNNDLQLLVKHGVKWDIKNKKGQNIMHLAVEGGNTEALKYFKSLGADVNARDMFGRTPLLLLAYATTNFADTLAWLVSEEVDLHAFDSNGNNLVFWAVLKGKSKDQLQLLVNTGIKWDIKNKTCQNIMHLAANGGNAEALKYFKSLGADLNSRDKFGYTPLLLLARSETNYEEAFAWFVNEQIDLHAVDNDGKNLVFLAALKGKSKDELKLLINTGVKWNIKNSNAKNIMHLAAKGGNTEALKYFKSLGADVNARDKFGHTPLLQIALAKTNFAKTFAWFVNEQIDLHAVDNYGNNLVFLAALKGKSKNDLQLLVNAGVKWDIRNKNGLNIMHLAAEGGNAEGLKYFKSLGADVNARDNFWHTPLLRLAFANTNFAATLIWFLSEQIDLHAVDDNGNNLIFLAASNGKSKDELRLLVESGVKWDIKNKIFMNIMHLAAEGGNAEALKYFKSLGADINARDTFGYTPVLRLAYAKTNFAEVFAWFVDEQINLHAVDNEGSNLVFLAALKGKPKDDLELLVNVGVKWDITNKNCLNILHLAAMGGNTEALKYFKSLGADVNARDKFGYTPLLRLARAETNFAGTLAWFVSEEVDLQALDEDGDNLVFLAALKGKPKDDLELLVNAGVKWDITNKKCMNIMHLAAIGGNVEALKYFKSLGANINARDKFGYTPLLRLVRAETNFAETFAWFVDEQINLNAVDNYGNNLVFLAALKGKSKNDLQLLVNAGVKWDIRNKNGLNIMQHLAAEGRNAEAMKYFKLLEAEQVF